MLTGADQPYEIEWAEPARRALTRLPEKVATAVVEFVYGPLAGNPQRVGHALRLELEGSTALAEVTTGSSTGSMTHNAA